MELRKHHLTCPKCVAQGGPYDVLIQEERVKRYKMNHKFFPDSHRDYKMWFVRFYREPNLPGKKYSPFYTGQFTCPYCNQNLEDEPYEFWGVELL